MAESTSDAWQLIFFGGAALFILLQTFRGWQLGVVRQTVQILAIGGAYASAWIGAPHVTPYLKPLGLPNFVLTAIGGAGIGMAVYLVVSVISAVLFKKTADQSVGVVRLGFGAAGAFVGMLFGLFIIFAAAVGIRVLGSLADAEIQASRSHLANGQARIPSATSAEPSGWLRSLAGMKHSLESGPAGSVLQQLDPVPGALYSVLQKVGVVVSDQQGLQRFMSYPGVKPLAEHPKIRALQDDPQIVRMAMKHDIFALLRNPNIVAAANDPEIVSLMRQLELEKALDYALGKPEKPDSAPPAR